MEEEALNLAPILASLSGGSTGSTSPSDSEPVKPDAPDQPVKPVSPGSTNPPGPTVTPSSTQLPIYNCTCDGGPGYRLCCDASGCKAYPLQTRNPFWPEFAHPSWLSCQALYNQA